MNDIKPTVLIFCGTYLPGYKAGGPIRSIVNLVDRLADFYEFRIITLDRDYGETSPYIGIQTEQWLPVGKANVMYLDRSQVSVFSLRAIIQSFSPDLIYLNSFFDPLFTQRVLWCLKLRLIQHVPIILAPRGEFSRGALNLKKNKKQLYIYASSFLGLYRNLLWQASTAPEQEDILRDLNFVRRRDIRIAINLAPSNDDCILPLHNRQNGAPLRICFLSRITPMKNLDFALWVLAEVKTEVQFTIYGPVDDSRYWMKCQSIISTLPSNIRVNYKGELPHAEVRKTLTLHDLFFLPTRGENYGHVIHEALGAGLPVLLSDQTPWNHVVALGIGWVHSLDETTSFALTIENYAALPDEFITEMRAKAVSFAKERTSDAKALEDNRRLLETALSRSIS